MSGTSNSSTSGSRGLRSGGRSACTTGLGGAGKAERSNRRQDEPVLEQNDATIQDQLDGIAAQTRVDLGDESHDRYEEVLRQRLDGCRHPDHRRRGEQTGVRLRSVVAASESSQRGARRSVAPVSQATAQAAGAAVLDADRSWPRARSRAWRRGAALRAAIGVATWTSAARSRGAAFADRGEQGDARCTLSVARDGTAFQLR